MALVHVAITVVDRERSARFYGEHFGLTERIHEDDDLLILGAADPTDPSELALMAGTPPAIGRPSVDHFGFRLADDTAVRAVREGLLEAGSPEIEWHDEGRHVRARFVDPDGYHVEVYAS